jgi:hypothetical protein
VIKRDLGNATEHDLIVAMEELARL